MAPCTNPPQLELEVVKFLYYFPIYYFPIDCDDCLLVTSDDAGEEQGLEEEHSARPKFDGKFTFTAAPHVPVVSASSSLGTYLIWPFPSCQKLVL